MTSVNDLLAYANAQKGKPYVWAATGPNAFDCSGLVQFVFHHFGINLPRTSEEQAKIGQSVGKGDIKAGDLVFSDWGDGPNSHVGIATGNGGLLNAPHTGAVVRVDQLNSGYLSHVTAVRRVAGVDGSLSQELLDDLRKGVEALPDPFGIKGGDGGIVGPLVAPLRDMADSVKSFSRVADLITKAFMPSNFVRISCGLAGGVLVLMGIRMLSKEVRTP